MSFAPHGGRRWPMGEDRQNLTREERLAMKLRENLRRRKQQAREMAGNDASALPKAPPSH